jgi:hypothetical protein
VASAYPRDSCCEGCRSNRSCGMSVLTPVRREIARDLYVLQGSSRMLVNHKEGAMA